MSIAAHSSTIIVSPDLLMTRRLVLRPLRKRDIDALHGLFADPRLRRQLGLRRVPRWHEAAALVGRSLAQRRACGGGLWALLESPDASRLSGFAGLWEFRDDAQAPRELVLAVADDAPAGALAAEAAQAIVDYARTILRWPCLRSAASPELLLRLGFVECSGDPASGRAFRIDLEQAPAAAPLQRAAGW